MKRGWCYWIFFLVEIPKKHFKIHERDFSLHYNALRSLSSMIVLYFFTKMLDVAYILKDAMHWKIYFWIVNWCNSNFNFSFVKLKNDVWKQFIPPKVGHIDFCVKGWTFLNFGFYHMKGNFCRKMGISYRN